MNNRKYYVYMHKNKYNNKVYIGMTCLNPSNRWANGRGYSGNKEFYEDILKYGWNNIEHIIIASNLTKEEAQQMEIKLIAENKNNCYNKTKGGENTIVKYNNQEEYEEHIKETSRNYYANNENYRKNKIMKVREHQITHREEYNKSKKDYYYKNEEYHKYKIEYQRAYRLKKKLEKLNAN